MNQNSSVTPFGFYETLRIFVTGYYFTTLLMILLQALTLNYIPAIPRFSFWVWFIFITLISGITMYAQESAKYRKAFKLNQPSAYLQAKARLGPDAEPLSDDEARRLYFYILNTFVPQTFHDKISYFGLVYYLMTQIRRSSLWFAVVASGAIAVKFILGSQLVEMKGLVGYAFVLWILYALNAMSNKADRKMQENYQDQIFWLQMNDDIVKNALKRRHTYLKQSR
ncbi:MAG TPA: hypothetical protein VMM57_05400 [Bacteroidota bacterium]|nr:hypothetical protein [Bacteroidota bacterium]